MRIRIVGVCVGCVVAVSSSIATAQVVIQGTESPDQTASSSRVTISTADREIVPLVMETRKTQEIDGAKRDETVTRLRRNDGSYFDWQQATTVSREVGPGLTETSCRVVQTDRQGDDRIIQARMQNVVKTDTGEQSQAKVYTRNSSGQLVLDQVVDATSVKNPDGTIDTSRVDQSTDVNGKLIVKKQSQETIADQGPNAKVTTLTTKSVNHLTGAMDVTEESTISARTDGSTKQIETVIRKPGRNGWEITALTTTTETTDPNGSISRETIEQGRSAYSMSTGSRLSESLVPQRKIVEREVRGSDGAVVVQREAFRRDVNGDWKPESFSKDLPATTIGERPALPAPPPPAPENVPPPRRLETPR